MYDRFDWRTEPSATSPVPAQPPVSNSWLYFTGELSDADCPLTPLPGWWNADGTPGPIPTVGQFYGVQLYDEYAGVVDFKCSAFVGGLSVGTPLGAVRQSDPGQASAGNGGQITVLMALSWTGGTINDGPLPAFLNLDFGANGTIAPDEGTTVTLGGTLTLFGNQYAQRGSTLTHSSGEWHLSRGNGIEVQGWATLNLISTEVSETSSPPPPGPPPPEMKHMTTGVNVVDGVLKVKKDARLGYYPDTYDPEKKYAYTEELPIRNDGGTVYVKQKTDAKVTGEKETNAPDGNAYLASIYQADGTTHLEAGSSFTVSSGMIYFGGRFQVIRMADATQDNTPAATINGTLTFSGTAILSMTSTLYEKLSITGDFFWYGGVVKIAIGKPDELKSDQIVVDGDVKIQNSPDLALRWSTVVPTLTNTPSWEIIKAKSGNITGTLDLLALIADHPADHHNIALFDEEYTNKIIIIKKINN